MSQFELMAERQPAIVFIRHSRTRLSRGQGLHPPPLRPAIDEAVIDGDADPARLTAAQIRAALIASAVREPGINDFSNEFGFGRVDIARCLEYLRP